MNKGTIEVGQTRIPRIIHYCWFGKCEKPKVFYRCLESWRRYCPDYEIREWNEDNFDVSIIPYVQEAYQAKKWAFVTDYARLWIVYHYGGIYLDTDVELLKPIDCLLNSEAFFGYEDKKYIATGLGFGAIKGNTVIEYMLLDYLDKHFLNKDGTYDKTTCPIRNTKAIAHLLPDNSFNDEIIQIEGAILYPPEFFCPLSSDGKNMKKTANTFSIHWFSASWLSEEEMIVHEWRIFLGKCERYLGNTFGKIFARFIYLFMPKKRNVLKQM